MSKASCIGFFVALLIGLGLDPPSGDLAKNAFDREYYLSGSSTYSAGTGEGSGSPVLPTVFGGGKLFSPAPLLKTLQTERRAEANLASDDHPMTAWVLFGLLLIAFSLFLLFHVRKGQAMAAKIKVLEEERTVLYNNAVCGYHALDRHGVIINANDTLLSWLGYERQEVIGKLKFSDIVKGDIQTATEKLASMSRNKSGRVDVTLMKKNDEYLPVILSAVNTGQLKTPADGRLFTTVDNTRCQEALEKIHTLDQELEAFSYSISHDLRAPLRSIDGYSRILEEDYGDRLDEEGKRVLNVVMNNAKRMGKLIDDLLDFGRLGRKALQKSNVNMTGIVETAVQDLKAQDPARRIHVTVEELMPAPADPDMLRQVWHNLLENAFKFTGKKENATIMVRSYSLDQNEVCYEVKDNGVGFDMQYGAKLFGIFQRLHKMQDFSGTGVGLAIVKRIINRHGGRVWAESAVNEGATFYFTLPTDDEDT